MKVYCAEGQTGGKCGDVGKEPVPNPGPRNCQGKVCALNPDRVSKKPQLPSSSAHDKADYILYLVMADLMCALRFPVRFLRNMYPYGCKQRC